MDRMVGTPRQHRLSYVFATDPVGHVGDALSILPDRRRRQQQNNTPRRRTPGAKPDPVPPNQPLPDKQPHVDDYA